MHAAAHRVLMHADNDSTPHIKHWHSVCRRTIGWSPKRCAAGDMPCELDRLAFSVCVRPRGRLPMTASVIKLERSELVCG